MAQKFLKISLISFLCATFCAASVFAQPSSFKAINSYAKKIDRLRNGKKLTEYFYPNKSCAGALNGWFAKDELVYFEAVDGDYDQESRYFVYVEHGQILKVVTKFYERGKNGRQKFKKIENSYPKSDNRFECGEEMIADLKRGKISANDEK